MVKSIRVRLQIWYAVVLLTVIGGFAAVLYFQVRGSRLHDADARLRAAALNLAATLRSLPPHEIEGLPHPPPPPPDRRRDENRDRFESPRPERSGDFGPGPPEDWPPGVGPPNMGPPGDGPPRMRPGPPGMGRPGMGPPEPVENRLRGALAVWEGPPPGPRERPYFAVWRANGTLMASSESLPEHAARPEVIRQSPEDFERFGGRPFRPAEQDGDAPQPPPGPQRRGPQNLPSLRWHPPADRESILAGPRGTTILVGQHLGRELADLRTFAWQLLGSGAVVLGIGLAGGWIISRSIARPITAIATTASAISASNLSRRIDSEGIDQELVGLATVLNEMFGRLEAAFERQSRFTSDASHELRTPLAVIHSHAELALSKPRSPEEYRETLTACLQAASRMATLVDGLLTLARADAGRLDAHFKDVNLQSIVEDVIEQYQPQAATAGIELAASLDEGISGGQTLVHGDPALLARIVSNLLSNALRYTPRGGRVQVGLSADRQGSLLVVEDSGCGIPLADQGQVFERFFRADKARSRAQGGNGLGLAICKSLLDVHHGTIGFTSMPDRGSRFEVRLPPAGHNGNALASDPPRALGQSIQPSSSPTSGALTRP